MFDKRIDYMERDENKMDTVEVENVQIKNDQKTYTSPSLTRLGDMQKLTLAGSKTGPLTDNGQPEQEV